MLITETIDSGTTIKLLPSDQVVDIEFFVVDSLESAVILSLSSCV